MEKMTKLIIDCSTGVTTEIEMTSEEIAQRLADIENAKAEEAAKQAELEAKAEAKASALAKLATLGLTEEEAKALGL